MLLDTLVSLFPRTIYFHTSIQNDTEVSHKTFDTVIDIRHDSTVHTTKTTTTTNDSIEHEIH